MALSGSAFSLTCLHESAYQLDMKFLSTKGTEISRETRIFTQKQAAGSGEILDIYSQNGVSCAQPVKLFTCQETGLFTQKDLIRMKKAADKLEEHGRVFCTVLVLDMKDEKKSYLDKGTIQKAEKAVGEFFKKEEKVPEVLERAEKMHQLFREKKLQCDFVVCEGSLKSDLLKGFSETEAAWLLNTKEGVISFCQYAEFYINAFKFGQSTCEVSTEPYFLSLSTGTFIPQAKSTVWYPDPYQETYALDGAYAQTLQAAFKVSGSKDLDKKITSMTVELK